MTRTAALLAAVLVLASSNAHAQTYPSRQITLIMPFDTIKDFTPVAFIARSPLLLTASNKLPVKSATELLALARSKPNQITYASAGPGRINQISAELIALSAG